MALFIDLHTHIDQYDPGELPGMFERAREAKVGVIIAAGVTVESTRRCIELANEFDCVFAGVGVHPSDLTGELDGAALDELRRMAADDRVVVMSEVGLDHQERSPDRAMQERAFRAQIGIAHEAKLPVVFHMRNATADMLRVLREERVSDLGGAAHYFQGNHDEATGVIDLGCYISLAKPLLRLPELQDVARRLPLDAIVLETDCYPQPFKGKRENWTEPKDVPVVAAKLAELKGIEVAEVMETTTANALNMLGPRAERVAAVL
ncbi:MAG: TatD family hydrolase [Chloroflexi bacterium]|nr:TatD family hydrolase [Chloroflexota bacterium]